MESNTSEMGITRLKEKIEKLVQERFSKGLQVYYLSRLGIDLGRTFIDDIEAESGMKLLDFIKECTELKPERSEKNPQVYFIRSSEAPNIDPADLPRRKIYDRAFWQVFQDPTTDGEHRFVDPTGGKIKRCKDGEPLSHDWIKVSDEFLSSSRDGDIEIYKRIAEWLEETGIDDSKFLQRTTQTNVSGRTVLSVLIEALSIEERKRLCVPLDIVNTLQDKKVE